MTNLWEEASRDHDAEFDTMQRSAARVAVAQWWPFLAAASSEREFGHRLALVKRDLLAAMEEAQVTSVRFQEETLEALAADHRLLLEASWQDVKDVLQGKPREPKVTPTESPGPEAFSGETATDIEEIKADMARRKEASGDWTESEWADDGETKIVTVPGREGYLVIDVHRNPDWVEGDFWSSPEGEWNWEIKAAYPLSEYPEPYSMGAAKTKEEAKAAAEAKVPAAITSYSSRKQASGAASASSDSGWTGMDAIDEAGLHAGKEHCSEGNPACNWGWRDSEGDTKEYACSVHGTVTTKSHAREAALPSDCHVCGGLATTRIEHIAPGGVRLDRVLVCDEHLDSDLTRDWKAYRVGPVGAVWASSKGWPEMPHEAEGGWRFSEEDINNLLGESLPERKKAPKAPAAPEKTDA